MPEFQLEEYSILYLDVLYPPDIQLVLLHGVHIHFIRCDYVSSCVVRPIIDANINHKL